MPHTTTKNKRSKRMDTRPNEKDRRKENKKRAAEETIQDLRVTKVQRAEKLDRIAQTTPLQRLSKKEKAVRATKKKLKAIHDLMERQKAGEELDEQQLEKIARLEETVEEMDRLLSEEG